MRVTVPSVVSPMESLCFRVLAVSLQASESSSASVIFVDVFEVLFLK
uniref:Uncharacterized protein n=1 Tax=Anguilla anguilla TaxID=7936 RepID=A0A0E9XAQ6_ANGAN